MRPANSFSVALFLSTLTFSAYGQENAGQVISTPASTQNSLTISELERIQEETVLYEFRAARAKAITNWQQNGNGLDAPLPLMSVTPADPSELPRPAAGLNEELPRILEISGSGKQLKSRLLMSDGTVVEASSGQRLPGSSFTVLQITGNGLQLKSDNGSVHSPAFSE